MEAYFGQLPMFSWVGLLIVVCVGILSLIYTLLTFRNKSTHKLPPGPYGLPIIGHLQMLGDLPHHNLHKLSQKHGFIMHLKLGNVPTVVVSSPESTELFLKTHDTNFANRPNFKSMGGDRQGMGSAQYGPYWRNLRRLSSIHFLNMSKVDSFKLLRKDKVSDLVRDICKVATKSEGSVGNQVVNMSNQVGLLIEKITYGMIFGIEYNKGGYNIKDYIRESEILVGAFNIADYIPFLRPFDLQGLTKGILNVMKNLDETIEKIIDEHEHDVVGQQKNHKDFIDVMLSLMKTENDNEEKLDRSTVKSLTLDMVAGAIDTSIVAIEWVLSELVRHPQVMKKLQEELVNEVGLDRMVEESDLVKLPYLEMVVKESLRLHPVAPLLIPHESVEDISIKGYHIAKGTRIMVNVWSIGRDPNVWSNNAEEFYPERFMNTDIDVRGHHFQLIPFGAGRRKCPGIELGYRQVLFVLAQLVHCFNLELPDGMSPRDLDMKEKFGITVPRANPLFLVPSYRLRINNI